MSHLSRRYTEHYYVVGKNGNLEKRDVLHTNSPKYIRTLQERGIAVPPITMPNAIFPCKHEKRDFLSKKGKKHNHTHARMKRKHKARMKARRCA